MTARHAAITPTPVHVFFVQCVTELKAVADLQADTAPEWSSMLQALMNTNGL